VSDTPSETGLDRSANDRSANKWQAFVERLYRQNEFAIKLGL
jgi:hypothetical protein